jgi:hypothetical protein
MPCNAMFLDEQSRRYVREMTEVLALRDLGRLKEFYRKWAEIMELRPMPGDKELEEDMHLMILELPGLEHLHASSRQWLHGRGLTVDIRKINCRKHDNSDSTSPDSESSDDTGCRGR